jgi:tetratricopeptide (TPR) repeat protein
MSSESQPDALAATQSSAGPGSGIATHVATDADPPALGEAATAPAAAVPAAAADGIDTRRLAASLRARMFGAPSDPVRIDRYVIIDRLGAGAMGIVYRAYDADLDRKVAIKLVHGDASSAAQSRLAREAQAIARTTHPNVVGVYDVGTHDGHVYVAMELVVGQTLREWMAQRPSWREVVQRFEAAARGLAAAHDAGVVHRDFKPDNVLLGQRGEVKVVDFGLAIADEVGATEPDGITLDGERSGRAVLPTSRGGSPAYMSPEQWGGGAIDARSDQWGFCVSLFEALWGQRPFQGDGSHALAAAILRGEITRPATAADVPRWLEATVRRGLSTDPDARWPSMHALADRLAHDPGRATRRRALTLGALVIAGSAGALSVWATAAPDDPCADAGARMATAWSTSQRAEARETWRARPLPYAAAVADATADRLDAWAASWIAMARDNCEATFVHGQQSAPLLDMRSACLRDRADNFDALVAALQDPDPRALERAPKAAGDLPSVASCGDVEAVGRRFPPPRDPEEVARVRQQLATARARLVARPDDAARTAAQALVERAAAADHPPVLLEALLLAASHGSDAATRLGQYEQAFWIASDADDDAGRFEGAHGAAHVEGALLEHGTEGRAWLRHAHAAAVRAGLPLRKLARIEGMRGTIALREGHGAESLVQHLAALALVEADAEADPLLVSAALTNLAASYNQHGEAARAEPLLERALAIETSIYGPAHPELASILINLGNAAHARGDLPRCRELYERAIGLLERTRPDAPELGMALTNLGTIELALGDTARSRTRQQQALGLFERTLGASHLYVASTLGNLARVQPAAEAEASILRAVAIYESHDPSHPGIGYAWNQLADLHNTAGRSDLALEPARKALAVRQAKLPADHPDVAWSSHVLGDTLVAVGRADEALPLLERALVVRRGIEGGQRLVARTEFVLGTALWATGDRDRARRLVESAAPVLRDGPSDDDRVFIERLDAWQRAHPR